MDKTAGNIRSELGSREYLESFIGCGMGNETSTLVL
jgi:hypothetical protein